MVAMRWTKKEQRLLAFSLVAAGSVWLLEILATYHQVLISFGFSLLLIWLGIRVFKHR